MDVKQIRKANLYLLKKEVRSWAEVARRAGTDPAYISQIVSKKAVREVGDDLARKLETGFSKPHGWMDHDHSKQTGSLFSAQQNTEQHGQYDQQGPKEHARSDADVPGPLITASMLTSPQGRRLQKLISDLTANGMTEEEVLDLFISVAQSLSKSLSASKKKITERSAQDALKEMIKRGGNTS